MEYWRHFQKTGPHEKDRVEEWYHSEYWIFRSVLLKFISTGQNENRDEPNYSSYLILLPLPNSFSMGNIKYEQYNMALGSPKMVK